MVRAVHRRLLHAHPPNIPRNPRPVRHDHLQVRRTARQHSQPSRTLPGVVRTDALRSWQVAAEGAAAMRQHHFGDKNEHKRRSSSDCPPSSPRWCQHAQSGSMVHRSRRGRVGLNMRALVGSLDGTNAPLAVGRRKCGTTEKTATVPFVCVGRPVYSVILCLERRIQVQ